MTTETAAVAMDSRPRFLDARSCVAVMIMRDVHQWYLVPRESFLRDVKPIAELMGYHPSKSLYKFLQQAPEVHDYSWEIAHPRPINPKESHEIRMKRHLRQLESTLLAKLFAGGWDAYKCTTDYNVGVFRAQYVIILYANPEPSNDNDDADDDDDTT